MNIVNLNEQLGNDIGDVALFTKIPPIRRSRNAFGVSSEWSPPISADVIIHAASVGTNGQRSGAYAIRRTGGRDSVFAEHYYRGIDRSELARLTLWAAFTVTKTTPGSLLICCPITEFTRALMEGTVAHWRTARWKTDEGKEIPHRILWGELLYWLERRSLHGFRIIDPGWCPEMQECRRMATLCWKTRGAPLSRRIRRSSGQRAVHDRLGT